MCRVSLEYSEILEIQEKATRTLIVLRLILIYQSIGLDL